MYTAGLGLGGGGRILIPEKSKSSSDFTERNATDNLRLSHPPQLVALIPISCLLAELSVKDAGCSL